MDMTARRITNALESLRDYYREEHDYDMRASGYSMTPAAAVTAFLAAPDAAERLALILNRMAALAASTAAQEAAE